ncbi:MAG: hypothetical protein HN380_11310, partial [Victivallales bacterium]|nr:hypothetical protein [Victivallales bacterium]
LTFAFALALAFTLTFALTLTLALALTFALTLTFAFPLTLAFTLTLALAFALAFALSLAFTFAFALSFALTLTFTLTLALALTFALAFAFPLTLTFALSLAFPLTLTFALSLAFILTLTFTFTFAFPFPGLDLHPARRLVFLLVFAGLAILVASCRRLIFFLRRVLVILVLTVAVLRASVGRIALFAVLRHLIQVLTQRRGQPFLLFLFFLLAARLGWRILILRRLHHRQGMEARGRLRPVGRNALVLNHCPDSQVPTVPADEHVRSHCHLRLPSSILAGKLDGDLALPATEIGEGQSAARDAGVVRSLNRERERQGSRSIGEWRRPRQSHLGRTVGGHFHKEPFLHYRGFAGGLPEGEKLRVLLHLAFPGRALAPSIGQAHGDPSRTQPAFAQRAVGRAQVPTQTAALTDRDREIRGLVDLGHLPVARQDLHRLKHNDPLGIHQERPLGSGPPLALHL